MGQLIQTKLHDSERTTLQYCVQIGFGSRPVLKRYSVTAGFLLNQSRFPMNQSYKRYETTVSTSLSLSVSELHLSLLHVTFKNWGSVQPRKWSRLANDPRIANDPGPQMIPKLDRKWSQDRKWSPDCTPNDPRNGSSIFAENVGNAVDSRIWTVDLFHPFFS